MKSRELLFCLAASLFAMPGCQSTRPATGPAGPAIVTLELRGHRITLHSGSETRYTITTLRGHLLARAETRAELRESHPELYELVRDAVVLAQAAVEG